MMKNTCLPPEHFNKNRQQNTGFRKAGFPLLLTYYCPLALHSVPEVLGGKLYSNSRKELLLTECVDLRTTRIFTAKGGAAQAQITKPNRERIF